MAVNVLKHANGTEVTAQEAYDAFMNTRVLVVSGGDAKEAVSMVWYDNNSGQPDATNVGYVELSYVSTSATSLSLTIAVAGDSSLVPK